MAAVTTVSADLDLTALQGRSRRLSDWLTTFPLAPVIVDPYTYESTWILDTARRILLTYRGAGCRACWIVTCNADDARRFLGPYAQELLTFTDPDRRVARGLGIEQLPAFCLIHQDGTVAAAAQGWDPAQWRAVAEAISDLTKWNRPIIPDESDPGSYTGTPAGG